METEERSRGFRIQDEILLYLDDYSEVEGGITVAEISENFDYVPVTVRANLNKLKTGRYVKGKWRRPVEDGVRSTRRIFYKITEAGITKAIGLRGIRDSQDVSGRTEGS